jgi:hypothetical protein
MSQQPHQVEQQQQQQQQQPQGQMRALQAQHLPYILRLQALQVQSASVCVS